LHHDRGRILVSRDTAPLQRPRRVNAVVRYHVGSGVSELVQVSVSKDTITLKTENDA